MHGNPLVIISVYIPHDAVLPAIQRRRTAAWEELTNTVNNITEAKNIIICGDFNAAIHFRKQDEDDIIGPHVYGKGREFLEAKEARTPNDFTDNREHLVAFTRETNSIIANTFMQHDSKHKVTYKAMATETGPPWTPDRYHEIDHCIVRRCWRNAIIDIKTDPNTNVNTDHFMMIVKIRQALKALELTKKEPSLKSVSIPEGEQDQILHNYNSEVFNTLTEITEREQRETQLEDLTKAIDNAARNNLQLKPPRNRRQDCHPELELLIQERHTATANYDQEEIKRITKEINKKARNIRIKQQTDNVKDKAWDPIKYMKKDYIPKHTKIRNQQGHIVSDNLRAETQADYYEQVQWKPNETQAYKNMHINTTPIYEECDEMNTGYVTIEEMNAAIHRLKKN